MGRRPRIEDSSITLENNLKVYSLGLGCTCACSSFEPVPKMGDTHGTEYAYSISDFYIYCFKVIPCNKATPHNWHRCPFAHEGERARRRDIRRFYYSSVFCPDVRKENGGCHRGDSCPWSHNVFEAWLHPERYRTQMCTSGSRCKRSVCWFAHSVDELRSGAQVAPPSLPPAAPLEPPPAPPAAAAAAPAMGVSTVQQQPGTPSDYQAGGVAAAATAQSMYDMGSSHAITPVPAAATAAAAAGGMYRVSSYKSSGGACSSSSKQLAAMHVHSSSSNAPSSSSVQDDSSSGIASLASGGASNSSTTSSSVSMASLLPLSLQMSHSPAVAATAVATSAAAVDAMSFSSAHGHPIMQQQQQPAAVTSAGFAYAATVDTGAVAVGQCSGSAPSAWPMVNNASASSSTTTSSSIQWPPAAVTAVGGQQLPPGQLGVINLTGQPVAPSVHNSSSGSMLRYSDAHAQAGLAQQQQQQMLLHGATSMPSSMGIASFPCFEKKQLLPPQGLCAPMFVADQAAVASSAAFIMPHQQQQYLGAAAAAAGFVTQFCSHGPVSNGGMMLLDHGGGSGSSNSSSNSTFCMPNASTAVGQQQPPGLQTADGRSVTLDIPPHSSSFGLLNWAMASSTGGMQQQQQQQHVVTGSTGMGALMPAISVSTAQIGLLPVLTQQQQQQQVNCAATSSSAATLASQLASSMGAGPGATAVVLGPMQQQQQQQQQHLPPAAMPGMLQQQQPAAIHGVLQHQLQSLSVAWPPPAHSAAAAAASLPGMMLHQ